MYIVNFNFKNKWNGEIYSYDWDEAFPSMISAVRFGMRKFRTWDNLEYFKVKTFKTREKYTLKYW